MADEIKAAAYCECSAKTGDGVREMFETAVRLTLYDSKGNFVEKQNHTQSTAQSERRPGRDCVIL